MSEQTTGKETSVNAAAATKEQEAVPATAAAHAERFEKRVGDLRLLLDDNGGAKVKAVRAEIDRAVAALTDAYADFAKFAKGEVEAQSKRHNDEMRTKIVEIEDKASLKIMQRIDEMDKKKREEIETAKKYAVEKSVNDAINVIDQLEIAIGFGVKDPAFKNYLSGFRMVLDMFMRWLAGFGVSKIVVQPGEAFDEKTMSAVEKIPSAFPLNHVADVRKSGYMLHDRVVRHASVGVSDGSLANTAQVQPTVELAMPLPQQVIAPTTVLETKHIPASNATEARHRAAPPPPIKK